MWSLAADRLKTAQQWRWRVRLGGTVAAAALTLAATQLKPVDGTWPVVLSALAAVALAAIGWLRSRQDKEQMRRWTRARSVSEAIKTHVYTFLAQDAGARRNDELDAAVRRLEDDADDLIPVVRGMRDRAVASPRPFPQVDGVESYLRVRVRTSQLENYYEPNAKDLRRILSWAKGIEIALTLLAAGLAAVAVFSPNVGAWAAVVAAATGAFTAYVAAERYEFLWIEYSRTADELDRLLTRRTTPDGVPLVGMDLVTACEDVISVQNQAWMAKWGEKGEERAKGE